MAAAVVNSQLVDRFGAGQRMIARGELLIATGRRMIAEELGLTSEEPSAVSDEPVPEIEFIQEVIAAYFHIEMTVLLSKKRTQHVAFVRQVAVYLARKLTGESFTFIAAKFKQDHSTSIHSVNLIDRRMADAGFAHVIKKIEQIIQAGPERQQELAA